MSIQFKRLCADDIIENIDYFKNCALHLSDYSAAFKIMWQDYFTEYFALVHNCLVFMEYYQGRTYFYYPLSMGSAEDEAAALDEIERYCRENNVRLHYTSVPSEKLCAMVKRYGAELRMNNKRRWRDYLYNAQDFVTYGGKKFSGQRNHVNKFKKLSIVMYPF